MSTSSFIGNCVGRIKTMWVSGPPKPHDLDDTRAWYAHHRAGTLSNERLDALVEKLRRQGIPVSDQDIQMMSRAQLFSPKQVQDLINRDMLDPTMMGSMALNDIKVSNADLDNLDKRVLSQWMADTGKGGVGGTSFFVTNPALRPELRSAVFGAFMGDYFNTQVAATPNGPQALQALLSNSYHGMSGVSKIVTPTMQEAERLSLTNVTSTTPPATDAQKAYIAARMKNDSWAPQMLKTDFWDDFGKQVYGTVVMTAAGRLGTGGMPGAPGRGKVDYAKILDGAGPAEKDAVKTAKTLQGEHSAPGSAQSEQAGGHGSGKPGQGESTQNAGRKNSQEKWESPGDGLVVKKPVAKREAKNSVGTVADATAPSLTDLLNAKWGSSNVANALAAKQADPVLSALLTDDEYLAIRGYTSPLYSEINPALRSGNPGDWNILTDNATSGMNKLAKNGYNFNGEVVRNATFTESQVANLFPAGGTYTERAFLSTTNDLGGVFPGNVQFHINSESGVLVQDLSEFPSESEVLFKPNTTFNVLDKTYDTTSNMWHIFMSEAK